MGNQKDQLNYEKMVQSALRNVVQQALKVSATKGLPGEHHFYISFAADYPGVAMPDYLREEYPTEMTIVLQHEFWDLEVTDQGFSVTLCFDEMNERLTVPFDAITSFVDPSVKFGLQFTPDFSAPPPSPKTDSKKDTSFQKAESESNVVTLDTFRKK